MKNKGVVHVDYESAGDPGRFPFDDKRVVVVIRRKIWCLTLPIVYGRYKAFCDPNYEGKDEGCKDSATEINVLTCIKGIDPEVGAFLSRQEQIELLQFFVSSMNFIQAISPIRGRPFILEAVADLQAAVNHLVQTPHHYGQSKWASQQMVEKFLKSFLRVRSLRIPKTHDLHDLAARTNANGLVALGQDQLQDIVCTAGVRYGEQAVTGVEAVSAHHASLSVCAVIAPYLKKPNQAL